MKLTFNIDEIKHALLVHAFAKTGLRTQPEDVKISKYSAEYDSETKAMKDMWIEIEVTE